MYNNLQPFSTLESLPNPTMPQLIAVALLLLILVLIALVIYWLFFFTEGAYLGERVVVWLYDLYAGRYDSIKNWDLQDEVEYLAEPFVAQVEEKRRPPLILDVAAGSGRLTLAVRLGDMLPDARWVLLDASRRMLQQARQRLGQDERLHYVQHTAQHLPFDADQFDVVSCMEALEFLPDPAAALDELVRVLRPGGLLFITNRTGMRLQLMPGRVWSRSQVFQLLKARDLRNISIRSFLVDYEWVTAVKKGRFQPPGRADDPELARTFAAMDIFLSPDRSGVQ